MRSLLAWILPLWLAACSSTPIPQPPPENLDVGKIRFPETSPTTNAVQFSGDPGAAPPNSIIRITNLETAEAPLAIQVASDGSFTASISVDVDDELRFQVRVGEERKAPIDLIYVGGRFDPAQRIDCFHVSPETDLGSTPVGVTAGATLALENDCDADAAPGAIAFRTGNPAFGLAGAPPGVVAAGTTEILDVELTPSQDGESEEILLISVQIDGDGARYPVTLHGVGR